MPQKTKGKILKTLSTVDEACTAALHQSALASCQATFAVGGLLMCRKTGQVFHEKHNMVVQDTITSDPTAHGERQLVDWYYANRTPLALPAPEDILIVTSMDPCCMCTGSIATAGFHAVIAGHDTSAGINYDLSATFPCLHNPGRIANRFSYTQLLIRQQASDEQPLVHPCHYSLSQTGNRSLRQFKLEVSQFLMYLFQLYGLLFQARQTLTQHLIQQLYRPTIPSF